MIKLSRLLAPVFVACLFLAGCFTSEQPLFPGKGTALMGAGVIKVTTHMNDQDPEGGELRWVDGSYVDETDKDKTAISFHGLPYSWPWDGWHIGQTQMRGGYIYGLYRKQGDRILVYDLSCTDLTDVEIQKTHLAKSEGGQECKVTRKEDLVAAFHILLKRKASTGYWTYKATK